MTRRVREVSRVRKNMDMDAHKLAEAQRVLGAATETEAVDLALDYVLFQGEVFGALDRLAALGGLDDPYAAFPARRPTSRRKVAER
jgi:Arc/MetJ family transcription regulator